ncbi:hypothetical protein [Flavobacterium taihuense]|uniref:Uncharacterized protein n=1 Tax=Flavobacterium taihuense TaxID=2857508 RepID=A0ABS6XXU5_9FLAO|nr:hypothetical protein [Flavobacterium taihuense]MBW4361499.1 hypothetical protein [Flavobacterium taihuense]
MKITLKNKKTTPVNILIVFFASLYDLVIDLFASLYDLVHAFIFFLFEYVKWAINIRSTKSTDFSTQTKEPIQFINQTPFDIR